MTLAGASPPRTPSPAAALCSVTAWLLRLTITLQPSRQSQARVFRSHVLAAAVVDPDSSAVDARVHRDLAGRTEGRTVPRVPTPLADGVPKRPEEGAGPRVRQAIRPRAEHSG